MAPQQFKFKGKVYKTMAAMQQAQRADAAKTSGKKPRGNQVKEKKKPSPFRGWESTDVDLDLSSGFAAVTLPAGSHYTVASIRVSITTGDVTKLNWRYAFSTSANKAPSLAELVDLGARGGHDISYFKKDFMLELPKELKVEDPVHPIFLTFAKKSVVDDDDEDATFAFSMRLLKPKASSSALISI